MDPAPALQAIGPTMTGVSRRTRIAAAATAAAVVVALAIGLTHDQDSLRDGAVRLDGSRPLPAIAGPELVTGKTIDLARYRGKPLIVNAWASWCVPCRDEAPLLKQFAESHPDIAVVGLNVNNAKDDARKFRAQAALPFPSIYDPDGKLALVTLEIAQLPSTLYVDSAGVLRGRTNGPISTDTLSDAARRLR